MTGDPIMDEVYDRLGQEPVTIIGGAVYDAGTGKYGYVEHLDASGRRHYYYWGYRPGDGTHRQFPSLVLAAMHADRS